MTRAGPGAAEDAVTVGVDTHKDFHVAVALDHVGRRLGATCVPTTAEGYGRLARWAEGFGTVGRVGVEGTGSFGAGLARFLRARGFEVLEVGRPKRRDQHRNGKSDPIDAELAARTVLAGTAVGAPKGMDGRVEMIRPLRAARRSAVKARTQAYNQLRDLLVTAPEGMRARLRGLSARRLAKAAARFRPGPQPGDPEAALKFAMRSVARRYLALAEEIASLESELGRLVAEAAPRLLAAKGIGTETAAVLLVAAGDNPERLRSEAAFAHLCGVAPIPASSGNTVRHRLNRRGNREANWALYMIVVGRLRTDERTRRYAAKRRAEGKTKKEIIRCLKRYVAREVYRILVAAPASSGSAPELAGVEAAPDATGGCTPIVGAPSRNGRPRSAPTTGALTGHGAARLDEP
jgi:transposase